MLHARISVTQVAVAVVIQTVQELVAKHVKANAMADVQIRVQETVRRLQHLTMYTSRDFDDL